MISTGIATLTFEDLAGNGLAGLDRPVKITGMPLPTLHDGAARQRLGDEKVYVTENYRDAREAGRRPGKDGIWVRLDAYFHRESSTIGQMVPESAAPAFLLDALHLPDLLAPIHNTRFFAARAGSTSDMHMDWMSHWLLHIPLFGQKRFVFLPPTAARHLDPLDNLARRDLRGLGDSEWEALVAEHGGTTFKLDPGDAMLHPPFWWHHVEYLTDAAALSIGLGPVDPEVDTLISSATLPRNWRLAGLLSALASGAALSIGQRRMIDQMLLVNTRAASPVQHN